MIPAQEAFYHRITGNYAVMNAGIDKEELLHMVTAPPEIYLGEGASSILTNYVDIQNQQENRIELVNNLLNRIVLMQEADLAYQDRVYITNVLNKLGIRDVSQFMKQVRILKDETKSTQHLISLYWNHMEELKSLVEEYQSGRVEVKQYVEAGEEQRGLYLHEEIMNRLKTGALYQILSSFYENHNGRGQYVTNQELKLVEQKRVASNILLNRLEAVAGGRRVPFVYRHENYYEEIHSEERELNDHSVNSQITSAVLLNLIDNLYWNQFEKQVKQSAMWLHMEEALYQNAENTLLRLRSEAAGEGISSSFQEEYSSSSYQTLHRHMDAVLRLLSVNQELNFHRTADSPSGRTDGEALEDRQEQEGGQIPELSYRKENNWQENLYQNIIEAYFESLDQIPSRRDRQAGKPSGDIRGQAQLQEEKELREHPRQSGESLQPLDVYGEAVQEELRHRIYEGRREEQRPLELHFSGGERTEKTIEKTEERVTGFQEGQGEERPGEPDFAKEPGQKLLLQAESYQQKLTENIENHLERQNIYVRGEAPGPEAGALSGDEEASLSFSGTENRISLEDHSTQEEHTQLLQQLQQINQKNIENYHRYQELLARQQEAQKNKKRDTRAQMRQESLEALKAPRELLERYREETVLREQERTERLREMTELLPEQTRKIYQALENYQADPGRWEGSQAISRNNLGLLIHDVEEAERENRRMELVMQEQQGQKDETVSVINRWDRQARQEFRTASREETSYQDISLVHRTAENQISQELIEQLTAQRQSTVHRENRVTERREEQNETKRLDAVQTQMAARQQLFRETENLTEMIEQGVRRQMNSISEQVYSKLEKRLQNEKKRRGY